MRYIYVSFARWDDAVKQEMEVQGWSLALILLGVDLIECFCLKQSIIIDKSVNKTIYL